MAELEHYKIIRTLGEGAFGKVSRKFYLVGQHLLTGKKVAIKCMKIKKAKKQNLLKNIYREVKILKCLDHPNIVKL